MSLLFKNADILVRKDGNYETLHHACLGIEGKHIDYIGTQLPEKKYTEERDFSDKLLMPGLVNPTRIHRWSF